MCKALDDWIKEERENGRREGTKQEKEKALRNMLREGLDESLIIRILDCTKEELAAAK